MFDELQTACRAGPAARQDRRHLQRPEGALRRHRLRPAGRPAGGRVQFDKGQADAAAGRAGLGGRQGGDRIPQRRPAAPGRACWPTRKGLRRGAGAPEGANAKEFGALAADRRGDILMPPRARPRTRAAYGGLGQAMDPAVQTTAGWSTPSSPRWAIRRRRPAKVTPVKTGTAAAADAAKRGRPAVSRPPLLALAAGGLPRAGRIGPSRPNSRPSPPIAGKQVWSQRIGSIDFPLAVAGARGRRGGQQRRHGGTASSRHRPRGLARQRRMGASSPASAATAASPRW